MINSQELERKEILKQYRHLLDALRTQMEKGDKQLIRLAFEIALDAHKDMRRKSGEPYIMHPLAVSQIVASEIGLGPTAVICALLHDVVEDTETTLEDIERDFGKKVRDIVDGLTKIETIFDVKGYLQAENIRKILLTMAKDVRVVLIKLADRLHNMRTLDSLPRNKQLKITSETLYLYVPLAHRLGLHAIKTELEDLAMKYNEPKAYRQIVMKLAESKRERTQFINNFIKPIKEALTEQGFVFRIFGRPKSVSSIWRKIKTQNISFEEVYDRFAIRVILDLPAENEKAGCWRAYSIITDFYKPNPDRLRDWISTPKANGYEALHTTVMSPSGKWVEVQIRSTKMDETAEKGYAAHWRYKEKSYAYDEAEPAVEDWLRQVRELLENPNTNTLDFIDDFKLNLYADEIYVFTPKGELKILPAQSSVLDMAFDIHSDLGLQCLGAKVNHSIVPISYSLSNGDQIEILTSKKQHPTEDWLRYVVTAKAKSKIKDYVRSERNKIAKKGKSALDNFLNEKKITINSANIGQLTEQFGFTTPQELYYNVGLGNFNWEIINSLQVTSGLFDAANINSEKNISPETAVANKLQHDATLYFFENESEPVDYNLAECCKPIPGDDVFGFVNRKNDVEIHRANCQKAINLISKYGYKIVRTKWDSHHQIGFLTGLVIKGIDDVGVMQKISNVISGDLKINMQSITIDTHAGIFEGIIKVYIHDMNHLNQLIDRLLKLDGILSVTRLEEETSLMLVEKN